MSNEKKYDGGPAYPMVGASNTPKGELYVWSEGMSLRDHFAAKALLGLMFDTNGENRMTTPTAQASPDELGRFSYQIADAMLKAREQ